MRSLLTFTLISFSAILFAADNASVSGFYQAVTDNERYLTIELKSNGSCETISGIYPIEDDDKETEEKFKCIWSAENSIITVAYTSGEVEKLEFSEKLPLSSSGLEGYASGLKSIKGEKYPISFGHNLWLSESLEKVFIK